MLAAGRDVRWTQAPGNPFYIAGASAVELQKLATDLGVSFEPAGASTPPAGALKLRRPRIGLADVYGGSMPSGHTRWLLEWLPNKREALARMVAALRPGGVLLVEEPDFVTIFGAVEPPALRRVTVAAMRHRVILNFEGEAEGISTDTLVQSILAKVRDETQVRVGV